MMKPYVYPFLPKEDLELFNKIERIIQEMPDIDLGKDENGDDVLVSCHMIAKVLATIFHVRYKEGFFVDKGHTHSWLVTKSGNIIDAYPWAMLGGPIIMKKGFMIPWLQLYREAPLPRIHNATFLKGVKRVSKIIRETMIKLGIEP